MKVENVSVKSKDVDLGTCNVEVFESYDEAVSYFEAKEAAAAAEQKREPKAGYGKERVMELMNSQHRANICNAFRVAKTRGENPITALKNAMKDNPQLKESLSALLAQYGLPGNIN